ncbi:endonuclease [Flavobacterium psychrophilum]|nr:endonuclease [Flavobacterium psychrophilum]
MKKIFTILLLSSKLVTFSQNGAPANPYYNGFDWTQNGNTLKNALATKITETHLNQLQYFQTENALQIIDRDPTDPINVFLIYGFSNNICTYTNETNYGTSTNWNEHRKRHREADQPSTLPSECVWNREHVFAKNLGTPNLDDNIPSAGTDAHHIRTSDVDRNALRGNKKFASGSGNSGVVGSNWYPGDEWKGDVARMMMYMYLRYPTQCKPINVGTGSVVATDTDMIQLFLQWNAEDPVSQYEDLRNTYLGNALNTNGQGNRNPFIDNPYLATRIWGGQVAQNRWPTVYLGTETFNYENSVSIYPNPTTNENINITSTIEWNEINIYNINGQLTKSIKKPNFVDNKIQISNLTKGFYFVTFVSENRNVTKKLIIN